MKKVLLLFITVLLVACSSKEDKANDLVKARGFECGQITQLEEFKCNPASAEILMVAYNALWRNDSSMRNMDLSSENIRYVYDEINKQEINAKQLLEKSSELSMKEPDREGLCGYYVTVSPTKINGKYVDKNRKCTKYEVFFDKDVKSIIGIHPIKK